MRTLIAIALLLLSGCAAPCVPAAPATEATVITVSDVSNEFGGVMATLDAVAFTDTEGWALVTIQNVNDSPGYPFQNITQIVVDAFEYRPDVCAVDDLAVGASTSTWIPFPRGDLLGKTIDVYVHNLSQTSSGLLSYDLPAAIQ